MAYTNTTIRSEGPYVINGMTTARIIIKTQAHLNHLELTQDDGICQTRMQLKLHKPTIACLRQKFRDFERELATFRDFAISLGGNNHLVIHRCEFLEERKLNERQIEELCRYPGVKYQQPNIHVWGALFVQTPRPSSTIDLNSSIIRGSSIMFTHQDFYYFMSQVDHVLQRLDYIIDVPPENPLMLFYHWYYAPDDIVCPQLFASIDEAREAVEEYIDTNQLYHHDLEKYRIISVALPRISKDDICKNIIFKACLERLDESCAGYLPAHPELIDRQLNMLNNRALYMTLVDTLHDLKYELFHVSKAHLTELIGSRDEDSVFHQLTRASSVSDCFKYQDTLQTALFEALLEAIWRDFAKRFVGVETEPNRPIML